MSSVGIESSDPRNGAASSANSERSRARPLLAMNNGLSHDNWQLVAIQVWTLSCTLLLIAVTCRLWLPPNWSSFPQIPVSRLLVSAPGWFDYASLTGLLMSTFVFMICLLPQLTARIGLRFRTLCQRRCLIAILIFGIALVMLNQHRLQAWFYQLLIFCCVFLLSDRRSQLTWLRVIVVSIYLYSAVGKLDASFAQTTGQELLSGILSVLHISPQSLSSTDRTVAALCLPLIELSIGVWLAWSYRGRQARDHVGRHSRIVRLLPGMAACLFHLCLSGLLLWQLQHSWGVVLWNLQFAVQAVLLFCLPWFKFSSRDTSVARDAEAARPIADIVLKSFLALTLVMPLLERQGYWDHWPSWALYAPHSSRCDLVIAPYDLEELPVELQELISQSSTGSEPVYVPIGQWSLRSLGAPIYPQARFQLGVARYLIEKLGNRISTRIDLLSAAERFTQERKSKILLERDQIQRACNQFWLNTQPRLSSRRS
jgi:hypothetical protein